MGKNPIKYKIPEVKFEYPSYAINKMYIIKFKYFHFMEIKNDAF